MSAEERKPVSEGPLKSPEDALAAFNAAEWVLWPKEPCPVPTNETWAEEAGAMPPSLRLAWLTVTKSKPELQELVRSLETDEAILALLEDWHRLAAYLQPFVDMVTSAKVRLGVAWGASLAADEPGRA